MNLETDVPKKSNGNQDDSIRKICRSLAGNCRIVASCLYGPQVSGYSNEKDDIDVLLLLSKYPSILKTSHRTLDKRSIYILTVDQRAFQRDVSKGWLGEFVAEKLMFPYRPLINSGYLCRQEIRFKKRIIEELLENIVLEFPELSHELQINSEYFMYETLMQRAKLFPPTTYRFLNMFRNDLKEKNIKSMMKGYLKALVELVDENWITSENGQVRITQKLVKKVKNRKRRIPIFLKAIQRAAWLNILSTLPRMMNFLAYDRAVFKKVNNAESANEELTLKLEDPKKMLLMPTPFGPVPLSNKTNIEEFVKKQVSYASICDIETTQIGGVLNSVYLITLSKSIEKKQKVVVKKFKNWLGFKWFSLALWSLGTKSFAVLGRSRLEREYALNQFLQSRGINVPKVLYVSPQEGLIFEEYVEGEKLSTILKSLITKKRVMEKKNLDLIKDVGGRLAEIHMLGVALGDCKPENIIVAKEEKLCFIDLEQASRDGDQTWDIAEFLYYLGHYVSLLTSTDVVEKIAKTFLQGYLEAGGNSETVKKAASPRYSKVFSIFTPPHVILAISTLLRRNEKGDGNQEP